MPAPDFAIPSDAMLRLLILGVFVVAPLESGGRGSSGRPWRRGGKRRAFTADEGTGSADADSRGAKAAGDDDRATVLQDGGAAVVGLAAARTLGIPVSATTHSAILAIFLLQICASRLPHIEPSAHKL